MAKKKRRKNGRGIIAEFGSFIWFAWRGFLKILPLVVIAALAAGVLLGVRSALYADSNFSIQQIRVEPGTDLSAAKRQSLESQYLGKNLLRVDLHRAAQDLQADPEIEWAHVERQFPSTLVVRLKRRVPVAYVRLSARADLGLVSDDGMILEVVAKPVSSELIMEAYSLNVAKPSIGYQIKSSAFHEAVRFIREYQKHPAAEKEPLASLSIDSGGNVSILLAKGPLVRLGRRPSQRLAAFEKLVPILQDEKREAIEYVDLQFDDIVIKRKGGKK